MICRDCGAEFAGVKTSHCAACHQTFTTVQNFDLHRSGPWTRRVCLDPTEVRHKDGSPRLVLNALGRWSKPGDAPSDQDGPTQERPESRRRGRPTLPRSSPV